MKVELNYNHLYYFWVVAREGSVVAASRELLLSQPTISSQLRALERSLRVKLFRRSGRGLELTENGRTVYRHASEMFSVSQDLLRAIRTDAAEPRRLTVGVADAVPKELVYRLLSPALKTAGVHRIICREDKSDRLLADLAANRLDLVLADAPLAASVHPRGQNEMLLESGVSFMATAALVGGVKRRFPASLDGAPMLLPSDACSLRTPLLEWFEREKMRPTIVGEFDDVATMASFARRGLGIFPIVTTLEAEMRSEYRVRVVGRTEQVRQRFYAVAASRREDQPGVLAVLGR